MKNNSNRSATERTEESSAGLSVLRYLPFKRREGHHDGRHVEAAKTARKLEGRVARTSAPSQSEVAGEGKLIDVNTGEILDGRYEITASLGAGGMGEIYKATHTLLGAPRVIKVIHARIAGRDDAKDRFFREAR